ncbi:hypothetical protein XENTR_v10013602 [Xenopus tropicalis]|nr:hypothetical protein XENTR_v10013602 [Xenopus tropicalis]
MQWPHDFNDFRGGMGEAWLYRLQQHGGLGGFRPGWLGLVITIAHCSVCEAFMLAEVCRSRLTGSQTFVSSFNTEPTLPTTSISIVTLLSCCQPLAFNFTMTSLTTSQTGIYFQGRVLFSQ